MLLFIKRLQYICCCTAACGKCVHCRQWIFITNEYQRGSCHTVSFPVCTGTVNQTRVDTSLSQSKTDLVLSVHRPRSRDTRQNTEWSRTRWRDPSQTWRNSGGKVKGRTPPSTRAKRTRYACLYIYNSLHRSQVSYRTAPCPNSKIFYLIKSDECCFHMQLFSKKELFLIL